MALPPQKNFVGQYWKGPEHLRELGPLTKDNVMHYFRWSPYWDRSSTNQLLRMQTEFSENKIDTDAEEHLRNYVGMEFALVLFVLFCIVLQCDLECVKLIWNPRADERCFVIQKRYRSDPTTTKPIALFYVLNDSVYQATDVYQLFTSRMSTVLHHFSTSLDEISEKAPPFNPRRPQTFKVKQAKTDLTQPSGEHPSQSHSPDDMQVDPQPGPSFTPGPNTPAAASTPGTPGPDGQTATKQKSATSNDMQEATAVLDELRNSWTMSRALENTLSSFQTT